MVAASTSPANENDGLESVPGLEVGVSLTHTTAVPAATGATALAQCLATTPKRGLVAREGARRNRSAGHRVRVQRLRPWRREVRAVRQDRATAGGRGSMSANRPRGYCAVWRVRFGIAGGYSSSTVQTGQAPSSSRSRRLPRGLTPRLEQHGPDGHVGAGRGLLSAACLGSPRGHRLVWQRRVKARRLVLQRRVIPSCDP
jgi:hypothetical protein